MRTRLALGFLVVSFLFAFGFMGSASTQASGSFLGPVSLVDTDEDGLPDVYEAAIATDPYSADTDGDGFGDGEELVRRSDPRTSASVPADMAPTNVVVDFLPLALNQAVLFAVSWSPVGFRELDPLSVSLDVYSERTDLPSGRAHQNAVHLDLTDTFRSAAERMPSSDGRTLCLAVTLTVPDAIAPSWYRGLPQMLTRSNIVQNFRFMPSIHIVVNGWINQRGFAVGLYASGFFYKADLASMTPAELAQSYNQLPSDIRAEVDSEGGLDGVASYRSSFRHLVFPGGHPTFVDVNAHAARDKVFVETLYVYPNGRYIVVKNDCDPHPTEFCPDWINTVTQTGRL